MRSAWSGIGRGMRGILRVYTLGLKELEVGSKVLQLDVYS